MTTTKQAMIALGPLGRSTTTLGFGCSGISGGLGRRRSLALLESAFDAGIRHFDVAPMYGYGTAEEVLGEFALQHSGRVTITTKYGIAAPPRAGAMSTLRALVRPVANRLPALRRRLIAHADSMANTSRKAPFTADAATLSLEQSLRKLRVERIDLFLLHEAEPADLRHDGLLRMLEEAQRSGKIMNFGVGSPARVIDELIGTHPEYCTVVQHEWSALDSERLASSRFHVCHRTIAGAAPVLRQWLQQDASLRHQWNEQLGVDVADTDMLSALLLKASLLLSPGMVLFSSRQEKRIRQNAAHALDESLTIPALLLYRLVRAHALRGDVETRQLAEPTSPLQTQT